MGGFLFSFTRVKTGSVFFSRLLSRHFPPCFGHVMLYPEGDTIAQNERIKIGIHLILVKEVPI